jgi:outer membrane immunogenic protein
VAKGGRNPPHSGELRQALLLAAVGVLGLVAIHPANAADMGTPPMQTKAPIVPAPVFNWTGFYIGGNGGGGSGHQDSSGTDTTSLGVSAFSGSATSSGVWQASSRTSG